MYVTLNQIVQDAIALLSQANGTGTQRYSQPRLELIVNNLFDQLYARQWWPDLMDFFDLPLDGMNGLPVGDMSAIKRYADIKTVFYDGGDVPLPQLPSTMNPNNVADGMGLYVSPQSAVADKVFRVWSKTATGRVQFWARLHPGRYTANQIVKFDGTALALGAAWAYAEDDGTNPGATQKFQNMFDNRINVLENELKDKPLITRPGYNTIPQQWSSHNA